MANTNPSVNSVEFVLNGTVKRTERVSPFTLFGDSQGDFYSENLNTGSYLLKAIATSGSQKDSLTVSFSIIQSAATTEALPLLQIDLNADIKVYPTLVNNSFHVILPSAYEENYFNIKIYNSLGLEILAKEVAVSANNLEYAINFTNTSVGVYNTIILAGRSKKYVKLIKAGQ